MKDYISAYERKHDHLIGKIVIIEVCLFVLVGIGLIYLVVC